MNKEAVAGITVVGKSEGLDKLAGDLNKVAAAQQNVAVVSEQSEKRTLSLEQAWKRQTLRLDEGARAQANIARETKLADMALREGIIKTQEEHAERIALINQRYNTASQSTQKFAQQTGLARHELINLGRQAQDVGVSLVSGQSPLMVLVQQGTQIADVFATSGGTVRGFFTQAIGFAGRFVASAAGVATAVGSIAAALLYAASSADAAQKAIDKVLTSGPGAASGLDRARLNQIAQGAVGSGFDLGEARAAALEFAKTGKIYEENIRSATEATRLFTQAAGIDAADASKQLAKALVDPSQGAQELNKQFGFLDATLLNHIRTLQSQGKLQEAQAALLAALTPTLEKQAGTVDFLTAAWRRADQSVIDFNKTIDKALGFNKDLTTQLDEAVKKQQEAASRASRGVPFGAADYRAATAEVERLTKALADLKAQTEAQRLKDLSMIADNFTRALIPSIQQVEQLTLAITKLKEAQAAGVGGPNTGAAIEIAQRQLALAQETLGVEQRKAEVFNQNAAAYAGVSASTAQTLAALKDQLGVAQAIGVTDELKAQRRATINQLLREGKTLEDATAIANAQKAIAEEQITKAHLLRMEALRDQLKIAQQVTGLGRINAQYEADVNELLRQGLSLSQAIAEASLKRAISLAQVNVQAERQLRNLQEQGELLRAASEWDRGRLAAAQEYYKLIDEGVSEGLAGKIAAQMTANARATEDAKEEQKGLTEETKSWSVQMDEANDAINRVTNSIGGMSQEVRHAITDWIVWGETIEQALTRMSAADPFKEGGYVSSYDPLNLQQQKASAERLAKTFGGTVEEVQQGLGLGAFTSYRVKMNDALAANTAATRENTEKTQTMTDVLSPFYSSDPRNTYLGFRAFAGGGIMTSHGPLPLKQYQGGGIANSPQVAVYGEGSTAEAFVPVPTGKIPVELKQPATSSRPVNVTINVMGNADANTVAALKSTAFQQAQTMRRALG